MSILKTTDFASGYTKIATDQYTDTELATFLVDKKLHATIKRIMGDELGQAFIDDLTGDPAVPVTAKWTTIFEDFEAVVDDIPFYCLGLKNILVYLTYCDYVSQQSIVNISTGNKGISQEAAITEGLIKKSVIVNNRAVEAIRYLQLYLDDKPSDYPNFDGYNFDYQSML